MSCYVLGLGDVDRTQLALVGGKAAYLGELSRLGGIRVPAGFCVTTAAFARVVAEQPSLDDLLDRLARLEAEDTAAIGELSREIRQAVEGAPMPDDVAVAITRALAALGEQHACAVRSSATAEDTPTWSSAGQQETYLNVIGPASIRRHVRRCWGSLFTERAATYRVRNGIDHRDVRMAVLVQRMVFPRSSGVLFTADPLTGNRRVATIDATLGLGAPLVAGLVNGDVYRVREGVLVSRSIAAKRSALHARAAGGTREEPVDVEMQERPALTDAEAVSLVQLGQRIDTHFGGPQDIEWCLVHDDVHIVQSRPITTLFPIPAAEDAQNRVYVSVGHQQMMTDAMKPLGISMWQLTAGRPMHEAGGRLFVDVTQTLASPASRHGLLDMLGRSDPLIRDALETVLDRDFIRTLPDDGAAGPPPGGAPAPIETDSAIVARLVGRAQASLADLRREIATKSGPALIDFIRGDIPELKRILFDPVSHAVIMAGMEATWWLNERLQEWLGEKNAADTLAQSAPGNVTSEMGLALLDVADAIRPHRQVLNYLEHVRDDAFLDHLPSLPGGREAREAILAWLDGYGMRCVGEIDITRPRWSERPASLVPLILANIRNFEPGAGRRRLEQGTDEARKKEEDVLRRLSELPDGAPKAEEAGRMIARLRTFIGYREYPKYHMVSRYFVYRQALLAEADRLVRERVLVDREDVFELALEELREVLSTGRLDHELIRQRRHAFEAHRALEPPRVITSDGEVINGAYRRDGVPADALVGLAVSAGVVEGRARVVADIADADLEAGDILVTRFTDPSWTPAFVAIGGLVTEVGGLMTHGAVIAREYGLPAVVGVEHATRSIRDGQRIRVHGTDGFVELLGQPPRP